MTNPEANLDQVMARDRELAKEPKAPRFPPLPHVRVGGICGLLELITDSGRSHDVSDLVSDLQLSSDDLIPILDAAVLLGFSEVRDGAVTLTDVGKAFAEAKINEKIVARLATVKLVEQVEA